MGVTIHFEGRLKSLDNYNELIETAQKFSLANNFSFSVINEQNKLLERVKNDKPWDYQGPAKGMTIAIDQNCDPLILEFDNNLYLQEYCKTQFSSIDIHLIIINFLRQIEKHFDSLKVDDEGEYWDTLDIAVLKNNIDLCFNEIEKAKKSNSSLHGPFRMDNGRIIDLMS